MKKAVKYGNISPTDQGLHHHSLQLRYLYGPVLRSRTGWLCNEAASEGTGKTRRERNTASSYSIVVGGCLNVIGGTGTDCLPAPLNFIGGGTQNCIDTSSTYSSIYNFIAGGVGNCMYPNTSAASILGGGLNYLGGNNSTIVGGSSNIIPINTSYNSILGGANNTNSGYYSAILGGSGNNIPAGIAYAGIVGCNIGAGACYICIQPHTFHVECLQACATPFYGTYPTGTLSYMCVTAGMIAIGFPSTARIPLLS